MKTVDRSRALVASTLAPSPERPSHPIRAFVIKSLFIVLIGFTSGVIWGLVR